MNILTQEMIDKLKKASRPGEDIGYENEDFNPADWSGDNFDDAYQMGLDHGDTFLAREILDSLGIEWNKE